ncbi:mirror-image polydactyly gene 1 protein-like [Oscarella lobularis]|uniref:mirror-image polydactyly gene 1 protein-like n=1 Tax=Oscarella lobularis TaxID=121494 RepID=UPI0033134C92
MASVKRDRRVKFDETEEKPRGDRDEVIDALSELSRADSATSIDQCGETILRAIERAKGRRDAKNEQDVHLQLERAVLERDRALAQVDRLSRDNRELRTHLQRLEEENSSLDPFRMQCMQTQLETVALERDVLHDQNIQLQEELENLRTIYSLHKSLSQEKELKNQFSTSMDDFEQCLRKRESEVMLAQEENRLLAARVEQIKMERNEIATNYDELQRGYKKLAEQNRMLNRYIERQGII